MNWFQKNFKTIIYTAFIVPILTVAIVSISHVTKWYGISNPLSWAIYLSIGIEIAALSALAAISARMGRKVYFPFTIVTLIQFVGNIFFAYQYIDLNSQSFKDWVDLVDPLVSYLGVESGDMVGHKRFLSLFAGGLLPIISLSFLHMLVKFEEDEKNKKVIDSEVKPEIDIEVLSKEVGKQEAIEQKNTEESVKLDEVKLNKIDEVLTQIQEQKFGKPEIKEVTPKIEIPEKKEEVDSVLEEPQVIEEEVINNEIPSNIEVVEEPIVEVPAELEIVEQTPVETEMITEPQLIEEIPEEIEVETEIPQEKVYSDDSGIKRLVYTRRDA